MTSQTTSQRTELTFPRAGYPATCHPDKPAFARGKCKPCWRKHRALLGSGPEPLNLFTKAYRSQTVLTRAEFRRAFIALKSIMTSSLRGREPVRLQGFGTFHLRHCAPRRSYILSEGRISTRPAKTTVIFRPSNHVKYLLNPHLYKEPQS